MNAKMTAKKSGRKIVLPENRCAPETPHGEGQDQFEYDQNQNELVQQYITPNLLLDMFDEPIVFNRAFVGITHSAVAALFLSYATYTTEKLPREAEGWFTKTIEEWQNETGLTRFEQTTARRILREKEILIERRFGMPSMLWFKIRKEALLDALLEQSDARWDGLHQQFYSSEAQVNIKK